MSKSGRGHWVSLSRIQAEYDSFRGKLVLQFFFHRLISSQCSWCGKHFGIAPDRLRSRPAMNMPFFIEWLSHFLNSGLYIYYHSHISILFIIGSLVTDQWAIPGIWKWLLKFFIRKSFLVRGKGWHRPIIYTSVVWGPSHKLFFIAYGFLFATQICIGSISIVPSTAIVPFSDGDGFHYPSHTMWVAY